MEIISRQEAIKQGLKYYFTGLECPKGHISKRAVYNYACYECKQEARDKAENKRPELQKVRDKRSYQRKKTGDKYVKPEAKSLDERKLSLRAHKMKRHSNKIKRTPSWSDLKAITEFYKNCPEGMVVDHVIPLQGKVVSGLHCVENLQYLTPSENSVKSNSFEPLYTYQNFGE